MFLHALPTTRKKTKSAVAQFNWWAVHAETLTPIRILGQTRRAIFKFYPDSRPTPPIHASHPEAVFDQNAIAKALADEITKNLNPRLESARHNIFTHRPDNLPDHLIVSDINGDSPHLWRTIDPCVIYPVENRVICFSNSAILGLPAFIRSHTDLPVTGWQYYWDECQDALEEVLNLKS